MCPIGQSVTRGEEGAGTAHQAPDYRDSTGDDDGDRDGCELRGEGSTGETRGRTPEVGGGDRMGLTVRCPQEEEFRWLLHAEVHAVLRQLQDILKVTHPPVLTGQPSLLSTGLPIAQLLSAVALRHPLLRVQSRRRQLHKQCVCAARA